LNNFKGVVTIPNVDVFGLASVVIDVYADLSELNDRERSNEEFKEVVLELDIESRYLFQVHYESLVKIIKKNEELKISSHVIDVLKLRTEDRGEIRGILRDFDTMYKEFRDIFDSKNWIRKHLDLEEMKKMTFSFQENLNKLVSELRVLNIFFDERIKSEFQTQIEVSFL